MIISFAYTTPALLAGAKTVTRRDWSDRHAALFDKGPPAHVDAYDRSPRIGGRKVAVIDVRSLGREPIAEMPDSDYEAEGFAWLHANGVTPPPSSAFPDFSRTTFDAWRASGAVLYVVRFELVRVEGLACRKCGQTGLHPSLYTLWRFEDEPEPSYPLCPPCYSDAQYQEFLANDERDWDLESAMEDR